MKTIGVLTLVLLMPLACSKPDSAAPAGGTPAKAGAEAPKTAAAAPPKATFVQKGIQPGKVIVGYMQDAADASQCSALTDDPAKKDDFAKNGPELAKMMKGTIVPSCPTDNVVGTCNAGFGILINYSGPKYTKESAQKACVAQPHATWLD
jgi:hypothetical protein